MDPIGDIDKLLASQEARIQTIVEGFRNETLKALDEREKAFVQLLDNEIRSLQLWLADERKALVADIHGLIDRLNQSKLHVDVTATVPPRPPSE